MEITAVHEYATCKELSGAYTPTQFHVILPNAQSSGESMVYAHKYEYIVVLDEIVLVRFYDSRGRTVADFPLQDVVGVEVVDSLR